MKKPTHTSLIIRSCLSLTLALAFWSPVPARAADAAVEEKMMQHMMQHMQMGRESMAKCPMMKSMKGMDGKSGDSHKEHHQEEK